MHEWIVCDGRAVFQSPFMMKNHWEESGNSHPLLHVFHQKSVVSVVFDFNASLSGVEPVFPMQLSVDFDENEKGWIVVDVICVLFLLCSRPRPSSVSVVLDFSTSLSGIAPVSPMWLSVDFMGVEKSGLLMNAICVLFLLCSQLRSS